MRLTLVHAGTTSCMYAAFAFHWQKWYVPDSSLRLTIVALVSNNRHLRAPRTGVRTKATSERLGTFLAACAPLFHGLTDALSEPAHAAQARSG